MSNLIVISARSSLTLAKITGVAACKLELHCGRTVKKESKLCSPSDSVISSCAGMRDVLRNATFPIASLMLLERATSCKVFVG